MISYLPVTVSQLTSVLYSPRVLSPDLELLNFKEMKIVHNEHLSKA